MLKVIENYTNSNYIIKMKDMKPLQVGRLVDGMFEDSGHIVMRTANLHTFEVMDLSNPGDYWAGCPNLDVRLLGSNEYVTIKLFNEKLTKESYYANDRW